MIRLNSTYIYFLAIKKIFIRSLKEFFFSSNYYNKLLDTEVPSSFLFNPNPYLLSPFVSHNSSLIKISNENVRNFRINLFKNKEKNIHNFLWLNLIDRKNKNIIVQRIIKEWIAKYSKYTKGIWDEDLTSLRIISWISNADLILNTNDKDFNKSFYKNTIRQINFIKKNINNLNDENKKISSISLLILSGLVFKEYFTYYKTGLKELKKFIDNYFDASGFPINRNFENLLTFVQYFILIKECTKDAQLLTPDFLDEIIVYCKAGVRSREACEILHSMGYQKLNNLQGGMMRWQSEKMPTLLE